ncbi:aminotransferase class I/II-fold pyridoxal phosphate-dependent enzyme [Nocardia sp. CNY236]|uniref:aminotransferase class I/II-fold pyridoxal phosphate-dependent enzyme n=1 Tax=Nocardia sp. CNY236 TaxID=1169152 RepID=UPI000423AA2F|nr:aminotransferase class I/II-fold pyridoxal phosphate-dependent enzyme [Nocardia sp. CNY236]
MHWSVAEQVAGESAFSQLHRLLGAARPPAATETIELHLGQPSLITPAPPLLDPALPGDWNLYPRPGGSDELRDAYEQWLERRFGIDGAAQQGLLAIEPTPGSKQAVSVAIQQAVSAPGQTVVLPNPCHPAYLHAVTAAGAWPVFYRPGGVGITSLQAAISACRRAAAIVVCNPGSPGGETISRVDLEAIGQLAKSAGAVLIADECSIDLYLDYPVPGVIELASCPDMAGLRFVAAHSLSKRSAAPGLRSGFIAGDPGSVGRYAAYNRVCGVSPSETASVIAARLWSDDHHVARARQALRRNWDLAGEILGYHQGYRRPPAGVFLWLPVAGDDQVTRYLWCEHGLKVMPGRYLASPDTAGGNPGENHIRIALVHRECVMEEALTRLSGALRSW